MTKLKLSSKNSIKSALLFVSIIPFILSGCSCPKEPTFKEKDIPNIIRGICKDEYGLNVTTQRKGNTLWVYAPVERILHKDYGKDQDKIFDETISDKLRNILTTVGRVLISSDDTPEFFALLASDIKLGIDYTIIGNVLDMKKSYADFIPWTEINRRYVIKFASAPEAIGDTSGFHFMPHEITMGWFLKEQIAQRIGAFFQSDEMRNYFKVSKSEGEFTDRIFIFKYSIENTARTPKKIKVRKEILKIVAYCIKTYEFTEFEGVVITDIPAQETLYYSKTEILNINGSP